MPSPETHRESPRAEGSGLRTRSALSLKPSYRLSPKSGARHAGRGCMGSSLASWFARRFRVNHRREGLIADVKRALALPLRGGVHRDTLQLHSLSTHMRVTWIARPLHP